MQRCYRAGEATMPWFVRSQHLRNPRTGSIRREQCAGLEIQPITPV